MYKWASTIQVNTSAVLGHIFMARSWPVLYLAQLSNRESIYMEFETRMKPQTQTSRPLVCVMLDTALWNCYFNEAMKSGLHASILSLKPRYRNMILRVSVDGWLKYPCSKRGTTGTAEPDIFLDASPRSSARWCQNKVGWASKRSAIAPCSKKKTIHPSDRIRRWEQVLEPTDKNDRLLAACYMLNLSRQGYKHVHTNVTANGN